MRGNIMNLCSAVQYCKIMTRSLEVLDQSATFFSKTGMEGVHSEQGALYHSPSKSWDGCSWLDRRVLSCDSEGGVSKESVPVE